MRSLGTLDIVEAPDDTPCEACGGNADFGIFTTNNPIKFYCTEDLKAFLDTLKD